MSQYFHVLPYPDEELGSLVTRTQRRWGLSLSEFSYWYFGKTKTRPLTADNYLPLIARHFDWPAQYLIMEHSLAPYAVAGLEQEEQRQKLRALAAGIPSMPTRRIGPIALRWCPRCLAEDLSRYGESYWHRCHVLPGVLSCPVHDAILWGPINTSSPQAITTHRIASYWLDEPLFPHELAGQPISIEIPTDIRRKISVLSYLILTGKRKLEHRRLPVYRWKNDWVKIWGDAFLYYCGCHGSPAELPPTIAQILTQIAMENTTPSVEDTQYQLDLSKHS